MDITTQSFYYLLPRVLNELVDCDFVALDLELSGISLNAIQGRSTKSSAGKQTLQQRYEEVKEAAERYQVLQLGLTVAKEDAKTGVYTLKPYNLHLNPVLDQKLGLERRWMYQSGAVDFLMSNGFHMEAPYLEGLPYLSREEEAQIKSDLRKRSNSSNTISDIDVTTDQESLEFLKAVRQDIDEWIALGDKVDNYLNIPRPGTIDLSSTDKSGPTTINSFQKRLVHQLVRAEYPLLVSTGKSTFVQIIRYNEERENGVKLERDKRMQERITKQIGFRWIVEALVGGDLQKLDPSCLQSAIADSTAIEAELPLLAYAEELKKRLKAKRPTLVGHNVFTDLVNFYCCFFGTLPDRVEDFQARIHELFPVIIDTKYMATHNCGSINPKSALEEINDSLKKKERPVIDIAPEHSKYLNKKPLHEAGYDSLLTAQIMIRLSAQLNSNHEKLSQTGESDFRSFSTAFKQALDNGMGDNGVQNPDSEGDDSCRDNFMQSPPGRNPACPSIPTKTYPSQQPVNWTEPTEFDRIRSAFAHRTRFDLLTDQTEEVLTFPPKERSDKEGSESTCMGGEESLLCFPEDLELERKVVAGDLIPRFGNRFWKIYGNKLRVFGTQEGICILEN